MAGSAFIGFGGQLVRSLTQLAAAMERIRAGDFDTPLSDLQRRDEVGKIARGVADFSSTLRDLSEAKTHIEHLALHDQLTDLPTDVPYRTISNALWSRRVIQTRATPCCMSISTGSSRSMT